VRLHIGGGETAAPQGALGRELFMLLNKSISRQKLA